MEVNAVDCSDEPFALQSLCMNCYENGETRMLLTKIPHFKEVMVVSFECEHCGFRNNEIKFTGQFGEKGVRYQLTVPKGQPNVLSRQVVKSDSASVTLPELEFEIPTSTQKGTITTVEGLLSEAATGLRSYQEQRREQDPTTAEGVDKFLVKLDACLAAEMEFTVIVDDPAGNSYVESAEGKPETDKLLQVSFYTRTRQQQLDVGLLAGDEEEAAAPEIAADDPHHGHAPLGAAAMHRAFGRMQGAAADTLISRYSAPEEVLEFPCHCSACSAPCTSRMYRINIPFFKEVIIMADTCDVCGYKNSVVKGSGGISEKGRCFTLSVRDPGDLKRDVLKSETASVEVPELELEVTTGTLGGLITTVEGLLLKIKETLRDTYSFQLGDSANQLSRNTWAEFFEQMDRAMAGDIPWTLVLRDPLSNSFIAPRTEDSETEQPDPLLRVEDYKRSAEEDEEYGIDHLKKYGTGCEPSVKGLNIIQE